MATARTSRNCGFCCASYSRILYTAPGSTQCATVNTRVGAIRLPVQKLPREPTMVTTERPTLSLDDGGALPTIASAGADNNSSAAAASMEAGIIIGAAIAFGL